MGQRLQQAFMKSYERIASLSLRGGWSLCTLILVMFLHLQNRAMSGTLAKPSIEVFKARRELRLLDGGRLIKTYPVALGSNPVPPKERQGDRATPEGSYIICVKNPKSQYHLSL